jgi:hypothetical protein
MSFFRPTQNHRKMPERKVIFETNDHKKMTKWLLGGISNKLLLFVNLEIAIIF